MLLAVAASLLVGRYPLGFGGMLGMLFGNVPFVDTHFTPVDQTVPTAIRLLRIWCGVFVGAGLAASGAGYQTMFRNPLVSPDILGCRPARDSVERWRCCCTCRIGSWTRWLSLVG